MQNTNALGSTVHWLSAVALLGSAPWVAAQDFSVLRINEFIAHNESTDPLDSEGADLLTGTRGT
jgi:hypothetical protein